MTENKIKDLLVALGICDESSIEPYFPRVRDRDDVAVLRCRNSGVILLSRSDHMDLSHYEKKSKFRYWSPVDRDQAVNAAPEDIARRKALLQHPVANRKWIDIGSGPGGILDALSPIAAMTVAVEPQKAARETLGKLGYVVYPTVESVEESDFDVVSLFHVFEHLIDPIGELRSIGKKMRNGGRIYIEVPHANDFLISFLEEESFKEFTFWSEHLILHTRRSLIRFLEEAGFEDVVITGCQRYPLANHLHWLKENKPGGHDKWNFLRTNELDSAYSQLLGQLDMTDTLMAVATRKG